MRLSENTRVCDTCGEEKPITEYPNYRTGKVICKAHRQPTCRLCKRTVYQKKYRQRNIKALRKMDRERKRREKEQREREEAERLAQLNYARGTEWKKTRQITPNDRAEIAAMRACDILDAAPSDEQWNQLCILLGGEVMGSISE